MNEKSLAYAAYWRISLADGDSGAGALKNKDLKDFKFGSGDELDKGCLGAELVKLLFQGEADDVETVKVTIRPYVYRRRIEHGKRRTAGVPALVTPVVSHACVDRQGKIYPNSNTLIPRDLLEPLDRGSFSIGTVSELDNWLQSHQVPNFDRQMIGEQEPDTWHAERWREYRGFCKTMLDTVAAGWPAQTEPFGADDRWLLIKTDSVSGASRHILSLYDHLEGSKALRSPVREVCLRSRDGA